MSQVRDRLAGEVTTSTGNEPPAAGQGLPLEVLRSVVAAHPEDHLFVVVSGAHLYGCPSPESDIDLRACHRLPTERLFALERPSETVERLQVVGGRELEMVSHEVEKLLRLMLKRNGTLLEQIFSPLVVVETPALAELRELACGCVTRGLYHHYRALMHSVRRTYDRQAQRQVKPLLALYRVAMTAIHLLRSGEIDTNLTRLNAIFAFPQIEELIARKVSGESASVTEDGPYVEDIERLRAMLDDAYAASALPESPTNRPALDDFLYQQRWAGLNQQAFGSALPVPVERTDR